MSVSPEDTDAAWAALAEAGRAAADRRIDGLFAAEPDRLARLSLSAAGLEIDLRQQPWSLAALGAWLARCREAAWTSP